MKQKDIFIKKILQKAGKAINSYHLIGEGDHVLVAISGGIDSLVLLDILNSRQKRLPITYKLSAIHVTIKEIPGKSELETIQSFCSNQQVELHHEDVSFEKDTGDYKFECFPCSWNRRKAIFKKAEELGCNKIAFGHHMDDSLETLLMNMVHHAEISAIPPRLTMRKGNFEIIRPLILCTEEEIKKYADLKNIYAAEGDCPYEGENDRTVFKEIVSKLGNIHQLARINLFNSMDNITKEYLPAKPTRKE